MVVPYLAFPREAEEAFQPLGLEVVLVLLQGEEAASQASEPAVLAFLRVRVEAFRPSVLVVVLASLLAMASLPWEQTAERASPPWELEEVLAELLRVGLQVVLRQVLAPETVFPPP